MKVKGSVLLGLSHPRDTVTGEPEGCCVPSWWGHFPEVSPTPFRDVSPCAVGTLCLYTNILMVLLAYQPSFQVAVLLFWTHFLFCHSRYSKGIKHSLRNCPCCSLSYLDPSMHQKPSPGHSRDAPEPLRCSSCCGPAWTLQPALVLKGSPPCWPLPWPSKPMHRTCSDGRTLSFWL